MEARSGTEHGAEAHGGPARSPVHAVHVQQGIDRHRVSGHRTQPDGGAPHRSCSAAVALLARQLHLRPADATTGRGGRGGRGGGGLAGPVRAEFDINGGEPKRRPTASSKRWSATTTSPSAKSASARSTLLSTDGSEGGYYDPDSIAWSPDSKKLAVYKVRPGYRRYVHYVESSPEDQLQPKHSTLQYAKPGDVLDVEQPVLFHVATKKQTRRRHRALPQRLRRDAASSGGRTAARSPSNTTSAATRSSA